jgi:hypothetical protein
VSARPKRRCRANSSGSTPHRRRRGLTLKLRDAKITRLTGELVQEGVSYKELRQAGEGKGATILELQQVVETTRATLKTEKK